MIWTYRLVWPTPINNLTQTPAINRLDDECRESRYQNSKTKKKQKKKTNNFIEEKPPYVLSRLTKSGNGKWVIQ